MRRVFDSVFRIHKKLTLGMLIAKGRFTHVAEFDGSFAATVHKEVAVDRVEFSRSDDLSQLLHIYRLDVHNV